MNTNPANTIKTRPATSPLGGPKPATTNAAPSLSASEILEQFNRMGIDTRPRSGEDARYLRLQILEAQAYCATLLMTVQGRNWKAVA